MLLDNYTFVEVSSKTIERDGEQIRLVTTRGSEPREDRGFDEEYLNIDGKVYVPLMEYFQAGVEGKIPELIKEKIVGGAVEREDENQAE